MIILHMLIACEELPLVVTPEPEPTAEPSATPSVAPSPSPPQDHAEFWTAFNASICDAAITCGAQVDLDDYGCPDGIAPPACDGFDAAAAQQCLQGAFTCETLAGEARATAPLACDVVCDPPPVDTSDTGLVTPDPVTPPAGVTFTVTLADGDGVSDATAGFDHDILSVEVANGTEDYEFGYAQTAIGSPSGWFGESCFSSSDFCHPIVNDELLLTRVETPSAIVEGQTMLLPVEYPESSTPALTYYAGGLTSGDCWVWGDDPSYYAGLNCSANGTAPTPPVTPVVTPPVTPTPGPAVSFTVTLADGDGVSDATGGFDDDILAVEVFNGTESYEFGYAQTAVGSPNGWFGESCFSSSDYCHPIVNDELILTRVDSIAAIVEGQTMLLPVEFPESSTPALTYYVEGTTSGDCWAWGDDPTYYASLNCTSN